MVLIHLNCLCHHPQQLYVLTIETFSQMRWKQNLIGSSAISLLLRGGAKYELVVSWWRIEWIISIEDRFLSRAEFVENSRWIRHARELSFFSPNRTNYFWIPWKNTSSDRMNPLRLFWVTRASSFNHDENFEATNLEITTVRNNRFEFFRHYGFLVFFIRFELPYSNSPEKRHRHRQC